MSTKKKWASHMYNFQFVVTDTFKWDFDDDADNEIHRSEWLGTEEEMESAKAQYLKENPPVDKKAIRVDLSRRKKLVRCSV